VKINLLKLFRIIKKDYYFIRNHGFISYLRDNFLWYQNKFYDFLYGVETLGYLTPKQLGISNPDSIEYVPLDYHFIKKAFSQIPIPNEQIKLLDYGCGKGRVLVLGFKLGFNKVVGVELSTLSECAKSNLNKLNKRQNNNYEVIQQDATTYTVANDINLIYFFNPFRRDTLDKVINNIEKSFIDTPREIYIIYFNHLEFDNKINSKSWVKKISENRYHLGLTCAIYKTIT
jgi:SAM-dependent methyltransferase